MAKKTPKIKPPTQESIASQEVVQTVPVDNSLPKVRPAFFGGQKEGQFVGTEAMSAEADAPKGAGTKYETPRSGNMRHIHKIYEE